MGESVEQVIAASCDEMVGRLDALRARQLGSDNSRRGHPRLDGLVAHASQHLHAVDRVIVPRARSASLDVGDFTHAEHGLAVALDHVRALEHGSAYEKDMTWDEMWDEVGEALSRYCRAEERMVSDLAAGLPDDEREALGREVAAAERTAPARPHPYLPRRGPLAGITRWIARRADTFWDTVDNRYTPAAHTSPETTSKHHEHGAIDRYVMGMPEVDEEDAEGR